jgi:hypothetical protein
MNKLISSFKKWILGVFMVSLTATLSGEILEALSEEDACLFLENACDCAQYFKQEPILFVDVDKTIIRESSDFHSYGRFSDFRCMKPINSRMAQELRKFHGTRNIKTVALTSAKGWSIVENSKNYFDISPHCIAHYQLIKNKNNFSQSLQYPHFFRAFKIVGEKSLSEIRSEAMAILNLPFAASFGRRIVKLPPVAAVSPSPKFQPSKIGHYSPLPNHRILYYQSQKQNTPCNYYIQNTNNPDNCKKIIACPVYENGIIFSNFINQRNAWQKGLIMRSFFSFVFGKERENWPSISVIAIDDSLLMLRSMQEHCAILGIPFSGIHLAYTETPFFF